MTSTQQMGGAWKQFKGKLREAWGALTDNELDRYEGQLEQLIGYIQKTTGEERERVAENVNRISREAKYSF
jgi:uncharacterized protein YjbJ (UPF0337 family)